MWNINITFYTDQNVGVLELDDVNITLDVATTIPYSSSLNNLPQTGTPKMIDSTAATISPSTPPNG